MLQEILLPVIHHWIKLKLWMSLTFLDTDGRTFVKASSKWTRLTRMSFTGSVTRERSRVCVLPECMCVWPLGVCELPVCVCAGPELRWTLRALTDASRTSADRSAPLKHTHSLQPMKPEAHHNTPRVTLPSINNRMWCQQEWIYISYWDDMLRHVALQKLIQGSKV